MSGLDDQRIITGDVLDGIRTLPDGSVDCVVTSPPYWGLRDYHVDGQIGLEETPDEWCDRLVEVFRECRRVLADHGTLWVNCGDAYASQGGERKEGSHDGGVGRGNAPGARLSVDGVKPKDLIGLPWMLAFALRADGWWLRSEIIWAKPNPMPESVRDRPTKGHEQIFLMSKRPRYYYDADTIRQPYVGSDRPRRHDEPSLHVVPGNGPQMGLRGCDDRNGRGANARTVWQIATQPFPEAHFATFPEELPRRCITAGCPERVCTVCGEPSTRIVERHRVGDWNPRETDDSKVARTTNGHGASTFYQQPTPTTVGWTDCGHDAWRHGVVLDPFCGSGTTLQVARRLNRHGIGTELNPEYAAIAARRIGDEPRPQGVQLEITYGEHQ